MLLSCGGWRALCSRITCLELERGGEIAKIGDVQVHKDVREGEEEGQGRVKR
jgi:hypothetical protein